VILQLKIEPVLAKYFQIPSKAAFSTLRVVIQQSTGKLSGQTGGGGIQPLRMSGEVGLIDAGW
jgi:hypothetical protein